jgi:hypothetical protein
VVASQANGVSDSDVGAKDWACLSCSYSLAGHSDTGNGIRCPECGTVNHVTSLRTLYTQVSAMRWRVGGLLTAGSLGLSGILVFVQRFSAAGSLRLSWFLMWAAALWACGLAWYVRATRSMPYRWHLLAIIHATTVLVCPTLAVHVYLWGRTAAFIHTPTWLTFGECLLYGVLAVSVLIPLAVEIALGWILAVRLSRGVLRRELLAAQGGEDQ